MGSLAWILGKKKAGGEVSPSMEVSSIAQTRAGCPDFILATVLLQKEGWVRDLLRPFLSVCSCESKPWFLHCHPACCKSSSHCFSLACFLLLWFASVCSGLCVTQQPRKKNHPDSENPSVFLWLGPTCRTPPALWVGRCAECKHSRGKGWLRQEVVLPLS